MFSLSARRCGTLVQRSIRVNNQLWNVRNVRISATRSKKLVDIPENIDVVANVLLSSSLDDSFNVIKQAEDKKPLYELLLKEASVKADVDGAVKIFEKEQAENVLDAVTYHWLIRTFRQAKNIVKVEEYFNQMKENGVEPLRQTYNDLIITYATLKQADTIKGLLEEMSQADMIPSRRAIGEYMNLLDSQDDVDEIERLLEWAKEEKYEKIASIIFSRAVSYHARRENIQRISDIVALMQELSFYIRPGVLTQLAQFNDPEYLFEPTIKQ